MGKNWAEPREEMIPELESGNQSGKGLGNKSGGEFFKSSR